MTDESDHSNKLYWILGYEAGIELERERIIELLEAWLADDYADFIDTLELIKDKQKAEESNETEN